VKRVEAATAAVQAPVEVISAAMRPKAAVTVHLVITHVTTAVIRFRMTDARLIYQRTICHFDNGVAQAAHVNGAVAQPLLRNKAVV